jgi:hypothetical protein
VLEQWFLGLFIHRKFPREWWTYLQNFSTAAAVSASGVFEKILYPPGT